MKKENNTEISKINNEIQSNCNSIINLIDAFNDLPIIARLEYVKNIILDKGGNQHHTPSDPTLVVAAEVLDGTIKVLQRNPSAANLRTLVP